jgi:hypothetical protein
VLSVVCAVVAWFDAYAGAVAWGLGMLLIAQHDWDALRQDVAGDRTEVEPRPVPMVIPVDIVVEGGTAERVYSSIRTILSIRLLGQVVQNDDDDVAVVTAIRMGDPVRDPALRRKIKI